MHERYSHPGIMFLMDFVIYKRSYLIGMIASLAYFLNLFMVLNYKYTFEQHVFYYNCDFFFKILNSPLKNCFSLCVNLIIINIWLNIRVALSRLPMALLRCILQKGWFITDASRGVCILTSSAFLIGRIEAYTETYDRLIPARLASFPDYTRTSGRASVQQTTFPVADDNWMRTGERSQC